MLTMVQLGYMLLLVTSFILCVCLIEKAFVAEYHWHWLPSCLFIKYKHRKERIRRILPQKLWIVLHQKRKQHKEKKVGFFAQVKLRGEIWSSFQFRTDFPLVEHIIHVCNFLVRRKMRRSWPLWMYLESKSCLPNNNEMEELESDTSTADKKPSITKHVLTAVVLDTVCLSFFFLLYLYLPSSSSAMVTGLGRVIYFYFHEISFGIPRHCGYCAFSLLLVGWETHLELLLFTKGSVFLQRR